MRFEELNVGDFFEVELSKRFVVFSPLFIKCEGNKAIRLDRGIDNGKVRRGCVYDFPPEQKVAFAKVKMYKEYE